MDIERWDGNVFFVSMVGVSLSQFRKMSDLVDHPLRSNDPPSPPKWPGLKKTLLTWCINSETPNQRPQTKAIYSSSCSWCGHASGPAERRALTPKPHERQFHHLLLFKSDVACGQISVGDWWGSNFLLYMLESGERRTPRDTQVVWLPEGVRQDQTYPSIIKECKQQQWVKWERMK